MDKENLLKMYFENREKNGCFCIEKLAPNINNARRVQKIEIDGKDYFLKLNSLPNGVELQKKDMDSEVFCSHLFYKYGLKGATYVPVSAYGDYGVLSDSVVDRNVFDGYAFDVLRDSVEQRSIFFKFDSPMLDYCSDQVVKDMIKMSTLDLVVNNSDRRKPNYFLRGNVSVDGKNFDEFDLSKNEDVRKVSRIIKNSDSKNKSFFVDELRFIDNGFSAYQPFDTMSNYFDTFFSPITNESYLTATRKSLINKIKSDERINGFVPIEQTQELVESINLKESVEEVEDTFNLKMDRDYLIAVETSLDDLKSQLDE